MFSKIWQFSNGLPFLFVNNFLTLKIWKSVKYVVSLGIRLRDMMTMIESGSDVESLLNAFTRYSNREKRYRTEKNKVQKMERAVRIFSAEQYLVETHFYPHTAKVLGFTADTAEVVGFKRMEELVKFKYENNCGISRLRIYYDGKPFRNFNFSGNETKDIEYIPLRIV